MKFDLPPIDPTEAVIAAIGVYPVLERDPGKVRMPKIHEARDLSAKVERLARQLAADELQEIPADEVDYRSVLTNLIERKFTVDRQQDLAGMFPANAPAEAVKYIAAVGDLIAKLQKEFPVKIYETFAGPVTQLPSDVETWRWASLLQVVDSPLDVFPLIATGAITSTQAKAVRMTFPTLTAAIDSAVQQAVEQSRSRDKTYELPPRAEHGVRVWLNKPRFSPQMMRQFQTNVQDSEDKRKAQTSATASPPALSDLTSAQKSAYGVTR